MGAPLQKAGGGLIRKLVGAVAKEAPELSRGAAAGRRATVNIGLDIPGGGRLAPEEALAVLERMGARPVRSFVAQSDTEPTLVVELDRVLAPDEANEVSALLKQEAIAQVDDTGAGDLYGPSADKWKPFNGDYFIAPSGRRLTEEIMAAGNPEAVPGGVAPDPVMEKLDEIAAGLKREDEPVGYGMGGIVEKAAKKLIGAADDVAKKPMRLYHGTDFPDTFSHPSTTKSPMQLGLHLGTPEIADNFAGSVSATEITGGRPRIIPLDVDMKNPVRLRDNNGSWSPDGVYKQLVESGLIEHDPATFKRLRDLSRGRREQPDGSYLVDDEASFEAAREIKDIIRSLGHDGVVYTNRYEFPTLDATQRARMRDRYELNDMTDEQFRAEFPEAVDSYIALDDAQVKSPFGEGEGVGFQDGGPVRMAGGGLMPKVGNAVIDFLDFSGVAGKQIRDDVINNTQLRGDGRKFKEFFADVTSGKSDKYKPSGLDNYDPAIELGDDARAFRMLRDHYSGNFDNHIKTSIPGFDEVQNAVGSSLLKTYGREGADVLDIGSSEGALIKALSDASEGRIRTTGIDPNPDMIRTFREKPQAERSSALLAAFGSADDAGKVAWEEADGTAIPFFDPQGNLYDAAHEAMVFQFISNARKAQAERVKQMLKPKGIAIFEEKFGNPKAVFDANEAKKDLYKAQYYTPEQMEIKRKEVLNTGNDAVEGMTDLQVSQAEMEAILRDTFKNRAQFWDSGNFKGYAASDDPRALEDFLNNLQPLDSEYATTKTPRGFADGGPVWSEADKASMTHEKSYGYGERPIYLETMGKQVPLGTASYWSEADGSSYSPLEDTAQFAHDVGRLGIYAVPGVGPWIGAGLDTTEALATDDPTSAALAVGFGPGGKMAKGALTAALAYGMDPAEAEAGVFGRLGKWATTKEGREGMFEAMHLDAAGKKTPGEIMDTTGWFKDVDGHWKYWRPSQGGFMWNTQGRKLGGVLNDPNLFNEYPEFADMSFRRKNNEGAHFDKDGVNGPEIVLGDISKPGYHAPESGGPWGVTLHEVYHGKANKEGWPQGMSVMMGKDKAAKDMIRFLGNRQGSPDFVLGQDMFKLLHSGEGLGFERYQAEVGEALARREQLMREFSPELMGALTKVRGETPASQTYLDVPADAIFHPGEIATPDQYRNLLRHMDDKAVANDMTAAQGDVFFADTPPKKKPAPKRGKK